MQNIRRYAAVAMAVLVAALSGLVMHRTPGEPPLPAEAAAPPSIAAPVDLAAPPSLPGVPARARPADFAALPAVASCAAPTLTVATAAGAMLTLDLAAPCLPSARVELRLGDLAFAVLTDDAGGLRRQMPAMAQTNRVLAILPDGTELAASAEANELGAIERIALIAGASSALHLSAPGGQITLLGDPAARPALLAEVHSIAKSAPEAAVMVVADLTPATCGTDLGAAFWRAGTPGTVPLSLAMPDCDGIDGAVVLALPAAPLALAAAN